MHRRLIAIALLAALSTWPLAGCQPAVVDVDVATLTQVPGLPTPADYVTETVPWELDGDQAQMVEAQTTHYHRPGSPAGSAQLLIPDVGNAVRAADDPQAITGAVGIAALRYTTAGVARQDARRLERSLRSHGCQPESARDLLSGSNWADELFACQNLANGGYVRVMWRYRNVIIRAALDEADPAQAHRLPELFIAVDAHARNVLGVGQ